MSNIKSHTSVEFLAQQWARKYIKNIQVNKTQESGQDIILSGIDSVDRREKTAQKIMVLLRSISAKAWNKTEMLLSDELGLHSIDPRIINPWDIAADSFRIYEKALNVYTKCEPSNPNYSDIKSNNLDDQENIQQIELSEQVAPEKLAMVIGADIGAIRQKYTNPDPRIIGFVSMQFHYTGEMLIEQLDPAEGSILRSYFKVIDDHLYMPLQRAYQAAAKHDYSSPIISAVQTLLLSSTEIAHNVRQKIIELFPGYQSISGSLDNPIVAASTLRDVEMFQVYLWVCALEGNISAVQQELFPLCIMLYPKLKVEWELVRQMLYFLRYEILDRLDSQQNDILMPYFMALSQMFSASVLG